MWLDYRKLADRDEGNLDKRKKVSRTIKFIRTDRRPVCVPKIIDWEDSLNNIVHVVIILEWNTIGRNSLKLAWNVLLELDTHI